MNNPKLSRYRTLASHFVGVGIFLAYEILYLLSLGIKPSVQSLIFIYFYEVLFFVLTGWWYLPRVWPKIQGVLTRLFVILLVIIACTICICIIGLINLSIKRGIWVDNIDKGMLVAASWRAFYLTIICIAYSFARYSIERTKELYEEKMLKIKAETKLENTFIRSQINPHMLYNSLSFVYLKALKEAPAIAKTVELIVGMTEYALAHEKEDDLVSLMDDIKQMERYVELQQTLHNSRLQIFMNKSLHSEKELVSVPPLLFLNFIENIFKYGELNDPEMPARIEFYLEDHTLIFLAHNTVADFKQVPGNGIGLVNAAARIKKHYGNRSEINVVHNENHFSVEIIIHL